MSAFDIAGAVVATPLAIACCLELRRAIAANSTVPVDEGAAALLWSIGSGLWAVFCIARLCGASL